MESIGQLTGGVAHDFNNLLAVILVSLTLLKKGLPDDPRTSQTAGGRHPGRGARSDADQTIVGICATSGAQTRRPSRFRNWFPTCWTFLRQSVGPGISIVVDIPPDVHPVKVDANQLELALMNLAVNARDAMPKGGRIDHHLSRRDDKRTA